MHGSKCDETGAIDYGKLKATVTQPDMFTSVVVIKHHLLDLKYTFLRGVIMICLRSYRKDDPYG